MCPAWSALLLVLQGRKDFTLFNPVNCRTMEEMLVNEIIVSNVHALVSNIISILYMPLTCKSLIDLISSRFNNRPLCLISWLIAVLHMLVAIHVQPFFIIHVTELVQAKWKRWILRMLLHMVERVHKYFESLFICFNIWIVLVMLSYVVCELLVVIRISTKLLKEAVSRWMVSVDFHHLHDLFSVRHEWPNN